MPIHVMADHIARERIGGFEPQRAFNWTLEINGLPGHDKDVISLSLQSAFVPTCANEEIEIPFGNERVWVAGKANWERGGIVCRDYVDRPVAAALYAWRRLVYNPVDGTIGYAVRYKRHGSIILYGPDGTLSRPWEVAGMWPVSVSFAENGLDMANNDQVRIGVALRFDKAYGRFAGDEPGSALVAQ
jgi:hypothetical protein